MVSYRFVTAILLSVLLGCAPRFAQAVGSEHPAQSPSDEAPQLLEPGKKLENILHSGQNKIFEIRASLRQYLRITIEKPDLNLTVRLLGPGGAEETVIESSEDDGEALSLSLIGIGGPASRRRIRRQGPTFLCRKPPHHPSRRLQDAFRARRINARRASLIWV
jgi:hypothetical protein